MLNRIALVVIFVPTAIVLVALAVANRGPAAFTLDPFNPGNPALTLQMPLFVLMFGCLIVGLLVGSAVTWWKQGRYRKLARRREQEAEALRATMRKNPPASALPALDRPAA
jgi:uncharacterized integral membrane protein